MTPDYASPEQVKGQPITTASDIYSLGVLLYELLSGHRPYRIKSYTPVEIERVICEQEPERPSAAIGRTVNTRHADGTTNSLTPETASKPRQGQSERLRRKLQGDLDNIILMAMRKEPQRRYASVEQFSEDIRRHLEGLPVIARKDTVAYRTSKFIQRNKISVAAAAVVMFTVLGAFVATAWEAHVARAERAKAERRFNDVRSLVNSLLFQLHDEIEKLPGSTRARELLVEQTVGYLDSEERRVGKGCG